MSMESSKKRSHGMTDSPTWNSWRSMIRRCYEPTCVSYKNYGAKGIRVCQSWSRFEVFLSEMGRRPPGKTLDRIDPRLGYSKNNCRWASSKEQANNRKSNRWVTIGTEKKTIAQWVESSGVSYRKIQYRLRAGVSVSEILNPKDRRKS